MATAPPAPDIPRSLRATFTYADARAARLTKHALYRLRDEGLIDAIARGIFRRADAEPGDEGLLTLATRSPRATLCLASALARHGLSDAIPSEIDVALPRGVRTPRMTMPVRWHRFEPATFDVGRETVALDRSVRIGLYNAERSIIDAFRTRRSEGPELGNEALRRWLRRRGAQPAKLLAMARRFPRAEGPLRSALEILL